MIKPLEPDDEMPDLAESNRVLAEMTEAYNRQPNPEIGGFTPEMLFRLYRTDWNTAECPLKFGTDLPLSVLSAAPVFAGMRNFLRYAAENGGLALTAKGNLSRAVVADVMDFFLDKEAKERVFQYAKVVNEQDLMPVWRARLVLEMSGLLRKSKGRFVVPKTKLPLLGEERAGTLAALLFTTYFRKYNLGHMSCYPDGVDIIQHDAAYVLFTLGKQAREWTSLKELPEKLLHPSTRARLQEVIAHREFTRLYSVLDFYLLRNFEDWGLVVRQRDPKDTFSDKALFQITPFYDQWVRFE